jgi:hypothetical protein
VFPPNIGYILVHFDYTPIVGRKQGGRRLYFWGATPPLIWQKI